MHRIDVQVVVKRNDVIGVNLLTFLLKTWFRLRHDGFICEETQIKLDVVSNQATRGNF
jgi:hypothetical protein